MLCLTASCLLSFSAIAQKESSITVGGHYSLLPITKIEGGGFALAYQQSFRKSFFWKTKYQYTQGWKETAKPNIPNPDYELFQLASNHAGFHVSFQPGYTKSLAKSINLYFSCGPAISYQSTLNEISKYTYNASRYNYLNLNEELQEGLFLGGCIELELAFAFNENWSLIVNADALGYIKAQNILSMGLGINYKF